MAQVTWSQSSSSIVPLMFLKNSVSCPPFFRSASDAATAAYMSTAASYKFQEKMTARLNDHLHAEIPPSRNIKGHKLVITRKIERIYHLKGQIEVLFSKSLRNLTSSPAKAGKQRLFYLI